MTVFPRISVANSFMPAPPRIPRCLFFLSGTPSPGNRSETVRIVIERISVTHDVTFLYAKERFAGRLPEADSLDHIVIERSCFLGLVTSAVEAYNRETNGFLVGNRGTRLVRQRPREVTVLRAAYPLQTEDRKPNWVSHGNEKAFQRARGAIENADVGYAVLGGFHSHTGDDGAASLSRTDLDYVADELRRISRGRPADRAKWLEVVMALKRRAGPSSHEAGWATRRDRRKIGCTVALDATHGYDMTLGGDRLEGEPAGGVGFPRGGLGHATVPPKNRMHGRPRCDPRLRYDNRRVLGRRRTGRRTRGLGRGRDARGPPPAPVDAVKAPSRRPRTISSPGVAGPVASDRPRHDGRGGCSRVPAPSRDAGPCRCSTCRLRYRPRSCRFS